MPDIVCPLANVEMRTLEMRRNAKMSEIDGQITPVRIEGDAALYSPLLNPQPVRDW